MSNEFGHRNPMKALSRAEAHLTVNCSLPRQTPAARNTVFHLKLLERRHRMHNLRMSNLPHYALGATDEEHRRLIAIASHEEDRVIDACRRAGIGEGATVIDFGCGPLGALQALARVVGRRGRVIGVDGSERAVEKARTLTAELPQVRLHHADITEVNLEMLSIGEADLAYSRLVLVHQADPLHVLRNMASMVRSGGAVINHEPSDELKYAPATEPHLPALTRVWELVINAGRARGATTDFGRRGRTYLESAGLRVESHRAYFVHYPQEVGFSIPRIALQSMRPSLLQYRLASEDEIAQLDRELEHASKSGDVQWISSPLMMEWIGRR
jgi:SAM-dependent methyltransferase